MTPEQVVQILAMLADMRAQLLQVTLERDQLREAVQAMAEQAAKEPLE